MLTVLTPVPSSVVRTRPRTAIVASADSNFRQRLSHTLAGLRWEVREAQGGAEAWAEAESAAPEAVVIDSWLPDLELGEFLKDFRSTFPQVDLVTTGASSMEEGPRGPYRQELLYALRRTQDTDTAAWNAAPELHGVMGGRTQVGELGSDYSKLSPAIQRGSSPQESSNCSESRTAESSPALAAAPAAPRDICVSERLPELVGDAPCMLEVSRRIRLVAPRSTPVLIEGPTGSGKELVAEALHRLSMRNRKPFVAINCAAIPEALLEAELFGHTRGAFTGAVQGRVGRIEAADGGTLFLDEIGEMPLGLQSKLLRFIESGELQRVGTNETVTVDVRIVAATHQPLARHTQDGHFRADLYYRLAVFLIRTPSLAEHAVDLPVLVEHFMQKMGREDPIKRVGKSAMEKLAAHGWPGNVRELEHVLERGAILAGDSVVLTADEIDFGLAMD